MEQEPVFMLKELVFWHWWILAVALIILEMFAPAYFFLWMGTSAAAVGVLKLAFPGMIWEVQFVIFAVLSIASIILGRMYLKKNPLQSDHPTLSQRGHQYIGNTYVLETDITNGAGRVRIGDSLWRVEGNDASAGDKVKIINVNGASLVVEILDS